MNESAQREMPRIGIFWLAQTSNGEARLLAVGCPLDQAEPYGDCLTYGPGHYETWTRWRRDRTVDPALRAIVQAYEYEDWPWGRLRPVARSIHPVCRSQAPTGNDRAHRNPISFAGRPEHRAAERAKYLIRAALKHG